MADIQITCPSCGTLNTVSEFAAPDSIVCRECKEKLEKPAHAGKTKAVPTVHRKAVEQQTAVSPEKAQLASKKPAPSAQQHTSTTVKATTKLKREKEKFKISNATWAWLLFLALGATTGILRYGGVLAPKEIDTLDKISPYIYIAIHIFISANFAKDAIYNGIISILMPPYMIYYLFAVSDHFIFRAIVAGFAVGMGQATVIFFGNAFQSFLKTANDFIYDPW